MEHEESTLISAGKFKVNGKLKPDFLRVNSIPLIKKQFYNPLANLKKDEMI